MQPGKFSLHDNDEEFMNDDADISVAFGIKISSIEHNAISNNFIQYNTIPYDCIKDNTIQ